MQIFSPSFGNNSFPSPAGGRISLHTDPIPIKTIFKDGRWTLDELLDIIPATLATDIVNPAPPPPSKE